jgi:hypothetical protein
VSQRWSNCLPRIAARIGDKRSAPSRDQRIPGSAKRALNYLAPLSIIGPKGLEQEVTKGHVILDFFDVIFSIAAFFVSNDRFF